MSEKEAPHSTPGSLDPLLSSTPEMSSCMCAINNCTIERIRMLEKKVLKFTAAFWRASVVSLSSSTDVSVLRNKHVNNISIMLWDDLSMASMGTYPSNARAKDARMSAALVSPSSQTPLQSNTCQYLSHLIGLVVIHCALRPWTLSLVYPGPAL